MSAPCGVVVADIGGTHARFALARIGDGRAPSLSAITKLRVADYATLASAFGAFRDQCPAPFPSDAALAVATTVRGGTREEEIAFPNSPWTLKPAALLSDLGIDRLTLLNDFGAVAHAVDRADANELTHLGGPKAGLPEAGVITVMGPGTGLGVAFIARGSGGSTVYETEASHIAFAPYDDVEDRILHRFRQLYKRVSVERVLAGSGLSVIYATLCEIEGASPQPLTDRDLWSLALAGSDPIANAALDRYCLCLGSAAGDFVLAHGANALVMAGGLGERIGERLNTSGFHARMVDKGRFRSQLEATPATRTLQAEPGLIGAAVAFAKEHAE